MRWSLAAALVVGAGLAGPVMAQHAKLVLFGGQNEAALAEPREHRMVHPLTSPYDNEDASITTDIRAWYAYHDFPSDILLGGGKAQTAAVQARVAITDRLQLVAYKDGYFWIDTPAVDEDGWVDVAAGLKYAVVQDYENQFHWSVGAGYEMPLVDPSVFQNDDEIRLFTGVNKGFGRLHLSANASYFFGLGRDQDAGNSDRFAWHLHADYYVTEWFSPVLEINGYHITKAGTSAIPFQGADVFNLGQGEDDPVITIAPGVEFRPAEWVALRGAVEVPLTDKEDVYGSRLTFSAVFSF
jgi:hypothetical protein